MREKSRFGQRGILPSSSDASQVRDTVLGPSILFLTSKLHLSFSIYVLSCAHSVPFLFRSIEDAMF